MAQDPQGAPEPGVPHRPGGGRLRRIPGTTAPGGGPPGPPMTGQLRLLLGLTLLSWAVTVVDSLVGTFAGPTILPGMENAVRIPGIPGGGLAAAVMLYGLVLTTALYALVWFPLHEQLQWGWVLGLVFCSLAVLGDVFDLAVFLLDGHLLPALSSVVLVAVNVLWLVVAARPGVRAALR